MFKQKKLALQAFSTFFILFLCSFVLSNAKALDISDFKKVLNEASDIVREETKKSVLIEREGSAMFIGDIHGDIAAANYDIKLATEKLSACEADYVIFTGDYVDRGENSLEVIFELAKLKIAFPQRVYLLHGNHELRSVNCGYQHNLISLPMELEIRGYQKKECQELLEFINDFFDLLPFAAIIDSYGSKTLAVHGGIPELKSEENLIEILRDIPGGLFHSSINSGFCLDEFQNSKNKLERKEQILTEIVWNDPKRTMAGFWPGRGGGKYFWESQVKSFLQKHELTRIIRGHSHERSGKCEFSGTFITVMSNWRFKSFFGKEEFETEGYYAMICGQECNVIHMKTERNNDFSKAIKSGVNGFVFYKYEGILGTWYTFIITNPLQAYEELCLWGLSTREILEVFENNNKYMPYNQCGNIVGENIAQNNKFFDFYKNICREDVTGGDLSLMHIYDKISSGGNFFSNEDLLNIINLVHKTKYNSFNEYNESMKSIIITSKKI